MIGRISHAPPPGAGTPSLAAVTDRALEPVTELPFSRPEITEDDIAAVVDVLQSGWLTTGRVTKALEDNLAELLEIEHVVAVSSCTAALEICLAYLDLPQGSLVGIPTWTFVSTALAAVRRGLRPVLLDVDADTLNVSTSEVERAIELGVAALIPVHFGGVPVDPGVKAVAAANGIPIVEDAAHALGANDGEAPLAGRDTVGACFSFYATKNLTCAEGGAISTADDGLAQFARSFRQHGMGRDAWTRYGTDSENSYDVNLAGIKANMPDLLAAVALSQLDRFAETQRRRSNLVAHYRALLADVGITCKPAATPSGSAHHLMVIELPDGVRRSDVVEHMQAARIGTSVHFEPVHRLTIAATTCLVSPSGTPNADRLAARVLSLPLSTPMTSADVERVCGVLADAI